MSTSSGARDCGTAFPALLLVISIAGLVFNGLNLGVEFKGGSVFSFKPAATVSIEQVRGTFIDAGRTSPSSRPTNNVWRVTTEPSGRPHRVQKTVAKEYGVCRRTRSTSRSIGALLGW